MDDELKSFNVSRFQDPSEDKSKGIYMLAELYPEISGKIKDGKIASVIKELKEFSSFLAGLISKESDKKTRADYELIDFTLKFSSSTLEKLDRVFR